MIDPNDIHSLSDFQRNSKGHIRRLRKSGRAAVLTVNGKAAVVVQDAAAYSRLVQFADGYEEYMAVREGIRQMEAGLGIPAEQVFKELRAKYSKKSARRRTA
jgi:hypothetical protein